MYVWSFLVVFFFFGSVTHSSNSWPFVYCMYVSSSKGWGASWLSWNFSSVLIVQQSLTRSKCFLWKHEDPGTYIKSWAWLYVTVTPELVMETGKSWEVPLLLTQQIQWALGSVGNPVYNIESARSRPRVSLYDFCSAAPTLGPPHTPHHYHAPRKHTTQVNKDFVHYFRKLFPLLKESNWVTVFVS